MEPISLLVDPKGKNGVTAVKITDILYLSYISGYRKVAFYTADATYYFTGSKEYWTDVLNNSGARFVGVDRKSSVNAEKVIRTEEEPHYAYFEKFRRIGEKRCWLSKRGHDDLIKEMSVIREELKSQFVPVYQYKEGLPS
ncbi:MULTISPECIES: hypothetical protein [unclassified Paenibacillus]|uniref:hypothetical protein n=1 Tax=unclassified Paenibacillus TaxID=185978 RepID=UPI0009A7D88F|nr:MULTISPECIES: hypothetical protein [unclassified Paenibacillus]SLK21711.1 hypothetical protein SAMN06272722_11960 [Paenibacillus sp. RU5A]SOC76710.1 hypothetical protein SAMN05880581_11960 [Paenibacillus sp. RU26A]SOC78101.1 hypothetical protein SAMN05880586_11960 [Paenibacillus sp. RU5M]